MRMHPRGSHRASVVSMHSSVPRVPNVALLVALVCWWDVLLQLLGTILREQPYTFISTRSFNLGHVHVYEI